MGFSASVTVIAKMPKGPAQIGIFLEPPWVRHVGEVQTQLDQWRLF